MKLLEEKQGIQKAVFGVFYALALLAFAAGLCLLSSDAIHGRRAARERKTVMVSGTAVEVKENLRRNPFTAEDFQPDEQGWMTYTAGDYRTGVDVSSHQGKIDWKAVRESGVDFAIIRAGYRGYTSGKLVKDDYFRKNVKRAARAGLDVGAYVFSQAVTVEEAIEEAKLVLAQLKGLSLTMPIYFDWELIHEEPARTDDTERSIVTDCALAFCKVIEEAGYRPAVYCNNEVGYLRLDMSRLQGLPIWFAAYEKPAPDFYYHLDCWQYSQSAQVPGIEGEMDLNIVPIRN